MNWEYGLSVMLAIVGIAIVTGSYLRLGKNGTLLFSIVYLIVVPFAYEALIRIVRKFTAS